MPLKDPLYSSLTEEDNSEIDYTLAKRVFNQFDKTNLEDYDNFYLLIDMVLLADISENFRDVYFRHWETFKKYLCSRFPSFDPPCPPLFAFVPFRAHPLPKLRLFWLELTLSPLTSILVKFREKKLIMSTSTFGVELHVSFKKPQWNPYKMSTIGTWQKCLFYGDVCFIESSSKNQKSNQK